MRVAWRWAELRLLVPLALLVPLGFALTHVALTGELDPGPLNVAAAYVGLFVVAHLALVLAGYRGDQLILPAVATIGGVGLVMLNRLPIATSAFGLRMGIEETQLVWFAIGIAAMLIVAIGLRNDSILRHYKYTWAVAGAALLVITFLFGTEVGGARLWIYIGPINFQPGEFIKIALVVFIAGYLAETRALLAGASLRIGPISFPPVPYLLPMLAMFAIVMGIVVISRDLGTALLFFGIFLTMLFVATGRRSYVLIGLVLFVAGATVAYQLFGHVRVRVNAWIDQFADPIGAGVFRVAPLAGSQLPQPPREVVEARRAGFARGSPAA
jgi:cell division protein FtsW (lipid II flippase)